MSTLRAMRLGLTTTAAVVVLGACVGDDPSTSASSSSSGGASPDGGPSGDGSSGTGDSSTNDVSTTPNGGRVDATYSGLKDIRLEFLVGIAADALGRAYVYGHRRLCKPDGLYDVGIARIGESGAVDTTYGTQGMACVNTYATNATEDPHDEAAAVALDSNGRALVAINTSVASQWRIGIARLTEAGTLDPTFGGGKGFVRFDTLAPGKASAMFVSDTAIWIAGRAQPSGGGFLVKLDASGAADPAFGAQGALVDAAVDRYTSVAATSTDVFVTAVTGAAFTVKKLAATNASAVSSFGTGGTATVDVSTSYDEARTLMLDGAGRVVVGGIAQAAAAGQVGRVAAIRLLADGAPDTSFSTFSSGSVVWPIALNPQGHLQADGKVVLPAIVPSGRDLAVLRLTENGMPDSSYGTNGVAVGTEPRDDVTFGIARDPKSGGVFVAADANDSVPEGAFTMNRPIVVRFSP